MSNVTDKLAERERCGHCLKRPVTRDHIWEKESATQPGTWYGLCGVCFNKLHRAQQNWLGAALINMRRRKIITDAAPMLGEK